MLDLMGAHNVHVVKHLFPFFQREGDDQQSSSQKLFIPENYEMVIRDELTNAWVRVIGQSMEADLTFFLC